MNDKRAAIQSTHAPSLYSPRADLALSDVRLERAQVSLRRLKPPNLALVTRCPVESVARARQLGEEGVANVAVPAELLQGPLAEAAIEQLLRKSSGCERGRGRGV